MTKLILVVLLLSSSAVLAQTGAMVATYDLHAGVGFPKGLNAGARLGLLPIVSIEASLGLLPIFTPALSAGLNFHTAPDLDSDPAISILGTAFTKNDTKWYSASLMFGWLGLRKTSLHAVIRGGISLLYASHPDGSRSLYPLPAIEAGLAYGFR